MKITKTNQIAGYKCEIRIKTANGTHLKYFSSVSGVDYLTADQNCYKRIVHFCRRAIKALEEPHKKHWIDEHIMVTIKDEKLGKKDFKKIIDKIEPLIIRVKSTQEEIVL